MPCFRYADNPLNKFEQGALATRVAPFIFTVRRPVAGDRPHTTPTTKSFQTPSGMGLGWNKSCAVLFPAPPWVAMLRCGGVWPFEGPTAMTGLPPEPDPCHWVKISQPLPTGDVALESTCVPAGMKVDHANHMVLPCAGLPVWAIEAMTSDRSAVVPPLV